MAKLKSLDEFNSEQMAKYSKSDQPCPNGISCPNCGKELLDSNPSITLTSHPPQKDIHCPDCGYYGYRIA